MREDIKIKGTAKDELINEIVAIEWEMFDKVQNEGGRASCQDDEWTFYAMRYSQHHAFSTETLQSYMNDLQQAQQEDRNLLTEKYAYMMEFTDADYFDKNLKKYLPAISPQKDELIDRIANLSIKNQQEFEKVYPAFSRAGRPLMGIQSGDVSFHIYLIGELKTYSLQTLQLYWRDLHNDSTTYVFTDGANENTAFVIHRMVASFYGYKDLDEAEEKLSKS